jgi:hypothetical protein
MKVNMTKIGQMHHFSAKNYSRSGTFTDWIKVVSAFTSLIASLAQHGWRPTEPIEAIIIGDDSKDVPADRKAREDVYASMEDIKVHVVIEEDGERITKTVTVSGLEAAQAYRDLASGSAKLDAINGFRRTFCLPIANVVRHKLGMDPITEIPVMIHERMNDGQRITRCLEENTQKGTGVQRLSDTDLLSAALHVVYHAQIPGRTPESKLMAAGFLRGMAQKFARIVLINAKYPDLGILDWLKTNPNLVPSVDKEAVKKLLDLEEDPDVTPEQAAKRVDDYFKDPKAKPRAKAASAVDLAAKQAEMPVKIIKQVLQAAHDNRLDLLNEHVKIAVEWNLCYDALTGSNPDLLKAIQGFIKK